jgi:transcriptional regulator with XRE-family HTH domain
MLIGETPQAAGHRLRLTRKIKGWNAEYCARLVGVTSQNWYHWEGARGGKFMPTGYLVTFCRLADVTTDWILRGTTVGLNREMHDIITRHLAADRILSG